MARLCSVNHLSVVPFMHRRVPRRKIVIHATEAKAWLDRAGSTPLCIDLRYARYDSIQGAVDHALQQVFTPARVWKVVFVEICGPPRAGSTCIDSILNSVLGHAPVLERFSFEITGHRRPNEYSPKKTITIGVAPSLSSLSITFNVQIADYRPTFVGGLFHNVRELKLDWDTRYGDCLEILHQFPNVEVLCVFLKWPSTRTAKHTLGKLHTLDVQAMNGSDDDVPEFFDALCTPALKELTLDGSLDFSTLEPPVYPYLAQFLARSQAPLTSLSLVSTHMTVDDIISGLQHAPQLAILSGDCFLFRPEIMDALTPSLDPARIPICPQLTMISLKYPQEDFSALAAMIYARCAISKQQRGEVVQRYQMARLEVVEMPFLYDVRFRQCEGMAECEKDGLDLLFTF